MKVAVARAATMGLGALVFTLQGCPSAYQRTYEQQTQRLESERRAALAQQEVEHAQAQKYAAVVYFGVGSFVIDQDGARELTWFIQQMQPYPQAIIQVQGFADSTGSEAANQGLSSERAAAVAGFLSAHGIPDSRIVTQGFGVEYPAASNQTAQGRRNNRRVEVTVR